tara:strand:- start:4270 stop:4596 length:327 start_codon:yes stop_codon:yes gene_type:complete
MGDIVKDTLYLNNLDGKLSERVYTKFAGQVRNALLDLYIAGMPVPLKLIGTSSQIDSFMKSLKREKKYMDAYIKYGLNDDRTLSSRHDLMRAVASFEKETGLRWPFTN